MTVLHLVDGHAIGHRGYHGASGRGAAAALGAFVGLLDKLERTHTPTAAVIAFDTNATTWRHELFAGYKAQRETPEPELLKVIPKWRPMATAMGWPTIAVRGFEADDVLATIVTRALERGWSCVVHASDKDLHALVGDRVRQVTGTGVELDAAQVETRIGVPPARIPDYLAIAGDPGDGVPGVDGAGKKTAADLCRKYSSIDKLIAANPKIRGKYPLSTLEGVDAVRLSRRLVQLVTEVPLDLALEHMVLGRRDERAVAELLNPPRHQQQQLGLGKPGPHATGRPGRKPFPPSAAQPASTEDEDLIERAAIAEYDGGLSREDADRSAREQRARRSA